MDKYVIYGLIIAFFMATVISIYASSDPDGLEWVAETLGEKGDWSAEEGEPFISSPVPDYAVPGVSNDVLASSLAGLIGVVIMFLLVLGIGRLLKEKK